jgi:hypothetical protein
MNYKPIKEKFTREGYTHTLLKRKGDVAIYEQRKTKNNVAYEVIVISRHDGYTLGGAYIEPAETYPSNSEWGVKGFTYRDLTKAEEKFISLVK